MKHAVYVLAVLLGAAIVLYVSWVVGVALGDRFVSDPLNDSGPEELGEALLTLLFPLTMAGLWLFGCRRIFMRHRAQVSDRDSV